MNFSVKLCHSIVQHSVCHIFFVIKKCKTLKRIYMTLQKSKRLCSLYIYIYILHTYIYTYNIYIIYIYIIYIYNIYNIYNIYIYIYIYYTQRINVEFGVEYTWSVCKELAGDYFSTYTL